MEALCSYIMPFYKFRKLLHDFFVLPDCFHQLRMDIFF